MAELNDFSPESGTVSFWLLGPHPKLFISIWECQRPQFGPAWWLVLEQYIILLSSGLGKDVKGSERPSRYLIMPVVGIVPQSGSPAHNSHTARVWQCVLFSTKYNIEEEINVLVLFVLKMLKRTG